MKAGAVAHSAARRGFAPGALGSDFPDGTLDARLLPLVFRRADPSVRLSVLDVGIGCAESVRFLSGVCCRIAYADLYGELDMDGASADLAPIERAERFFASQPEAGFDVVLLGDFLNYLDEDEMRRFRLLLRSRLNSGAKAHGFAAFSNVLPLQGLRLSIRSDERLAITACVDDTPHRHTQKLIGRVLWPLSVSRSILQDDNRQELLLESRR